MTKAEIVSEIAAKTGLEKQVVLTLKSATIIQYTIKGRFMSR